MINDGSAETICCKMLPFDMVNTQEVKRIVKKPLYYLVVDYFNRCRIDIMLRTFKDFKNFGCSYKETGYKPLDRLIFFIIF